MTKESIGIFLAGIAIGIGIIRVLQLLAEWKAEDMREELEEMRGAYHAHDVQKLEHRSKETTH